MKHLLILSSKHAMASCQRSSRPRRLICTVAAARWRPAGWALHGLLPMGCRSLSEKMVKQQHPQHSNSNLQGNIDIYTFAELFLAVFCDLQLPSPSATTFGSWRSSPALPSPNCDPTIAVAKLGFWCPTFLKVRWHQNKSWSSHNQAVSMRFHEALERHIV